MEGAAPSRRGGVKSRRSRSFSRLLGGYPSIPQGPRSRSGESEDEEGQYDGANDSINGTTNSSSCPKGQFKTPSMKEPDSYDGAKAYKLRGFIQSFQLIFHKEPANFFSGGKKLLYSTSSLTDRAGKWIEP
ncbi:hypothetical protein O181_069977 [Austropuccinia psidii MF-1]|uniref:Uncharacterized protein n=1 Tax=Austropuccinia psidii MF-1 TaxID=1389203 RepID=A0A9Q3I7T6_9BASI|nr:hypothetical protein [Austropuccinia psidii MF-1]